MTTAADAKPRKKVVHDDPEAHRMTLGDHLEELRWRVILALVGFAVVFIVCLYFGNTIVAYFCKPLLVTLRDRGLPPWTVDRELGGSFMVFIHISLITAAAISAPWGIYQIWLFVAAGLYPHERKAVMRYAPLSIGLLVAGMLFVYFLVLPWTIQFFVDWTSAMPIPNYSDSVRVEPHAPPLNVPIYAGELELATLKNGDMYYNSVDGKLNFVVDGAVRSFQLAPPSLVVPQYELGEYISLVVMMLLTFGLAFQLPLVVVALLRVGIVEAETMRKGRKIVYFALLVIAAAITPGDVITATIALLLPLILLYELGIFLGTRGEANKGPGFPVGPVD